MSVGKSMENSLKGLILAAGTVITCIIISLGFYIAREAKDTAASGAGQINKLNAEFAENEKTLYDGTEVSGSEVLNVIRRFQNEACGIYVKTNKCERFYGYEFELTSGNLIAKTDNTYKLARMEDNEAYINPNARFMGNVIRDINNTITGIGFTQSK